MALTSPLRSTAIFAAIFAGIAAYPAEQPKVSIEGGLTLICQQSDDDRIDASLTASLDLYAFAETGRGRLVVYVEGNTTPPAGGVAERLPDTNGDAGSALDRDLRGRLQVSELIYDFSLARGSRLAVGLIDLSAYLDTTRINNDENLQFLAAPLINNPTIEFPDYTLGLVFRRPSAARRPEIHAALTASDGLADSPDRSYSELFDLDGSGKGLFAAVESAWSSSKRLYRLGAWFNGRAHDALDGRSTQRSNAGIWGSAARTFGRHSVNLRVGLAESDVSAVDRFASIAYQWDRAGRILGTGLVHSHASSALIDGEDAWQFEAYFSLPLSPKTFLTPSVQHLWNGGLDDSPRADRVAVFSLRLHRVL